MTTRAGTSYSPAQTQSGVTMDQNLGNQIKALNDQLAHITARLDHLKSRTPGGDQDTQTELDHEPEFETPVNPRRTPRQGLFQEHNPNRVYDPNLRRAYHYDLTPEYHPRSPYPYLVDSEERPLRSTQPYAPTFDGSLDPNVYIDWEGEMDQYFDWQEMSEKGKIKFAKLRLTRQAKWFWEDVERTSYRRGETPIRTWSDMKTRLREEYLPMSYKQKGSIIHQAKLNRTNILFDHRSLPIPIVPIEYKDELEEELDMTNPDLVDQDAILTKPVLKEQLEEGSSEPIGDCEVEVYEAESNLVNEYEGEDCEEFDIDKILPEENLGKDQVIGPSPGVLNQEKISEDLVPIIQYPQTKPTPLVLDPFFDMTDLPFQRVYLSTPVGQNQNHGSINHRPSHELSSEPFLELVNSPFYKVDHLSPTVYCSNFHVTTFSQRPIHDSDSYFLPNPKISDIQRTFQLHFAEVLRLLTPFEPVRFATYFWKTLWNLLGVHVHAIHQFRKKPRE